MLESSGKSVGRKEKATSAAVGRRGEGKEGTPSEMLPTSERVADALKSAVDPSHPRRASIQTESDGVRAL